MKIRPVLVLYILNNWFNQQVNFVLTYPQAPLEYDIYMELPPGIKTKYGNGRTHVLQLPRHFCGQRKSGKVLADCFREGLVRIGFTQSKIDEGLFYRESVIFIVYVNDGIFASHISSAIDKAIQDLRYDNFDIKDQVDICDCLGINLTKLPDGRVKLPQPVIIDHIIKDVKLPRRSTCVSTPVKSTRILRGDLTAPSFEGRFNYRSVIGKLNFLEKSTCADISYATHQVAQFVEYTLSTHGEAVDHLINYPCNTRDEGLILDPKRNKSFKVFADANFAGNWYQQQLRKFGIIMFAN